MPEELFPNLFRIRVPLPKSPLKYLNSYVIRSEERNLVVDTGLNRRECLEAMLAGLNQLQIDLDRTDFFITHLHADHIGLVPRLVTAGRRVYFSRPDTELVKAWKGFDPMVAYAERNGFPEDLLRLAVQNHPGNRYGPDRVPDLSIVTDGDALRIGEYRFVCTLTPGHTPGHMCLYEPERKILIAGDHLLIDITPNIQCWSDGYDPLKSYLTSLDRVEALEIEQVLPGHRRLFSDHRRRIAELKQHHTARAAEVLSILDAGPNHAYQVASKMTWDIRCESWEGFPVAQRWFATGEAIAHLRLLEQEGRIFRRGGNQHTVYVK